MRSTTTALLALVEGAAAAYVGNAAVPMQAHRMPAPVAIAPPPERIEGTTWEGEGLVSVADGVL